MGAAVAEHDSDDRDVADRAAVRAPHHRIDPRRACWPSPSSSCSARARSASTSGRVADYDAVMIFFTTALSLPVLPGVLQRRRPGFGLLLLTGAATLCAVMTKDMSPGLMPGLGAALYMVATGRTSRLWQTGRYAVAWRWRSFSSCWPLRSPGRRSRRDISLRRSGTMTCSGRFTRSVIGDEKPRFYYLSLLLAGCFAATPCCCWRRCSLGQVRGRSRFVLLYALSVQQGDSTARAHARGVEAQPLCDARDLLHGDPCRGRSALHALIARFSTARAFFGGVRFCAPSFDATGAGCSLSPVRSFLPAGVA